MSEIVKKFLYLNRKAPYGTIYAWESLEVVLIGAAFDQEVSLLFVDDGVYQLTKGQDIRFTWLPGTGLRITVDHAVLDTIEDPTFAKSFFEIYFGPDPVNDGMKRDLLQLVSD